MVEAKPAVVATSLTATMATTLFKLVKVTNNLTYALWSTTKTAITCEAGHIGEEDPRTTSAGNTTSLPRDIHKVAASIILTATKGKQKYMDKPGRVEKYFLRQNSAKHRDTVTINPTDKTSVPAGKAPPHDTAHANSGY